MWAIALTKAFCFLLPALFLCLFSGSSEATIKFWIGSSAGNFNDTTRWSTISGGANNTTAPGALDIATFDSGGTGNCTITADAPVAGINIKSTYPSGSTITQNSGVTVTVGASNFIQAGGIFTGGDSTIDINGTFTLSGGTFTATTGTTSFASTFTHTAGGNFSPNGGTVVLDGAAATIDVAINETFYNLTLAPTTAGATKTVASGDTLIVTGALTLTEGNINTGTIDAQGAVTHAATFDGGTGRITITGAATRTIDLSGGGSLPGVTLNAANVTLNGPSSLTTIFEGTTPSFALQAGTFTGGVGAITFSLAFSQSGGAFTGGVGFVTFSGTVTASGGTFNGGSASLDFIGAATFSGATINVQNASWAFESTFTLSGGSFTANTNAWITFYGAFTHTAGGTFTQTNGTAYFAGSDSTVDVAGSETFYNVNVDQTSYLRLADGDTMVINGTLTLTNGAIISQAIGDTATFNAKGPISVASTFDGGYSATQYLATLLIDGTGDQSFAIPVGAKMPKTTLDNSLTTISFSGSGTVTWEADFTLEAGTVTGGDPNMTFSGAYTQSGGTFTAGAGTVTVTGAFSLSGGTFTGGSALTTFSSTVTASGGTLNGGLGFGSLAFNGAATFSGATVNGQTPPWTFNSTFTLSGGSFTAPSSSYTTFKGNFTHTAGGTFSHNDGTVAFTVGSATIDVATSETFSSLIIDSTGTKTIADNDTLVVNGTLTLTNGLINQTTIPATGSIAARGPITQASTFDGGTGLLLIDGNGPQTFTGNATAAAGTLPDVTIAKSGGSTLTLSGTIRTTNDWTCTGGTIDATTNGSTVVFAAALTISGSHTLNHVTFNGTGSSYTIASGTTLTAVGTLTLTDGSINTGTVAARGNIAQATTFDGGTGTILIDGSGTQTFTGGGSAISGTLPDIEINNSGGTLNLASIIRTTNDWTYTAGTVSPGTSTVVLAGTSTQSIGGTGSSPFNKLTVNNASGVTLQQGPVTVNGTLTLTSGNITTSSNTLALGSSATISRTSGYVIGNLKKTYSGTGSFTFTVGTVNGYSPVDVNVTASPGDFTVSATQSCHPNMQDCTHALQRYWTLTASGPTANLTFHYLAGDVQGTESLYYIVKYSGGWSFPGGSVDPGTHTGTITGVTSFSDWTLAEGAAPTAVKLISLSATEQGGKVVVSWRTGFEVDNLGFHVYRERGGERVRVTPSLVAGSALFAGEGTALTAGRSYAWWDPAPVAAASYWLEEWDLSGARRWYGPVVVEPGPVGAEAQGVGGASGSSVNAASAVVPSRLLATLGAAPAQAHTVRRKLRRGVESGEDRLAVQWGLAAGAAVKILVSGEGWYRVSQEELVMAGLDRGVDASRLQLFTDGQQVPILVDAREQGRFSPGDRIEFYGLGLDTLASGVRVYWLVVGAGAGERIHEEDGVGSWPSGPPSFPSEVERADRTVYVPAVLNGEASNFFGAVVTTTPVSEVVQVRHLDRSGAGALAVRLQGGTAGPHQVGVELNGNRVGTLTWTGMTKGQLAVPLGPGMAFEGDNVVTLAAEGGVGDVSLVDVVRLRYAHTWQADGEALACILDGFQKVTITGFASEKVQVFDVTDAMRPQQVVGEMSGGGGEYAVQFGVPEAGERTVLAVGTGAVLHPVGVLANRPSAWHSASPGADLVIIAHRSLLASVEPLRALREGQGVSVAVVDVEDVYDEFSYGEKDPQAIRDFMGWARRSWARAPRFLLLVGGASFDPRGYLGFAGADLVPTKLVDTKYMETASDDWFVDFDGDGIGDIPVGRLPVGRADRATAVVDKIVAYERSAPGSTALLVADADDSGNDFEGMSERVKTALPVSVATTRVYRGQLGDAAAASELASQLASGQSLVHYVGHGTVDAWHAGLLTAAQVAALHNERLPFVVTMTCLNGFFQDPSQQSLAQAWLEARGGAVAVWASSALTESAAQAPIDEALVRLLFPAQGPQPTLGEATRAAKTAAADPDVRTTWILFGDPSARLK